MRILYYDETGPYTTYDPSLDDIEKAFFTAPKFLIKNKQSLEILRYD